MSRKHRRPNSERPAPSPAPPPAPPRHRRRPGLGLAAAAVLAAGGAILLFWLAHAPRFPLPSIDPPPADPRVAATLEKHLAEVKRQPRSGPAWGWLGALLWVYDYRPQAWACLAQAERLDPANPRWPYYHGLALMIAAPTNAVEKFRQTTRICGNNPETPRLRLIRLLAEQGRWDEAQTEIDQLLDAKPDFTPARLLAARAAHARGDVDAAIELARACTQDPRTTRAAWALLAILLRTQGDATAAAQAAQRSTTAPLDEGAGDPFEAELTLRRGDPRALSEQAHPLLASGHLNEAAALIDRLASQHATFPDTWLLVGRLQLLRKNYPAAEQALRKNLDLSPGSAQGLFQLGLAVMAQNRLPEAAELFGQATRLKPDFGAAHFNRAVALARAGQHDGAAAAFRESLRHNPERLETYLMLADLLLEQGDKPEANRLLDQAQAIQPRDPRLAALRQRAAR